MGPERMGQFGNFPEVYDYVAPSPPPYHALPGHLVQHQPRQSYVPIRTAHRSKEGDLSIQAVVVRVFVNSQEGLQLCTPLLAMGPFGCRPPRLRKGGAVHLIQCHQEGKEASLVLLLGLRDRPDCVDGQEVRRRPRSSPFPRARWRFNPTRTQSLAGTPQPLFPRRASQIALYHRAPIQGLPPTGSGQGRQSPSPFLPSVGPRARHDTQLGMEEGVPCGPSSYSQPTSPLGDLRIPPPKPQKGRWHCARQAGETLIPLLLVFPHHSLAPDLFRKSSRV